MHPTELYNLQQEKLELFTELLKASNQKVNLVSKSEVEFLKENVLDSLLFHSLIPEEGDVLDLGSGGGFPVIPLAISNTSTNFTAIDSSERKCDFLSYAARKLKISNLKVIHGRIEDQTTRHAAFQLVTARALAPLPALLKLGAPFLDKESGAKLAVLKGRTFEEELAEAEPVIQALHLRLTQTESVTDLPGRDFSAVLVFAGDSTTS